MPVREQFKWTALRCPEVDIEALRKDEPQESTGSQTPYLGGSGAIFKGDQALEQNL
jgi:hypothetical protein